MMDFQRYRQQVQEKLRSGVATEHTYRPALEQLLEGVQPGVKAINEPRRVRCGAPDLIVLTGATPVGYIETKDIGVNLDREENSEQLRRYRASLTNLILTDYLEFRWYVNGEARLTERLASVSRDDSLRAVPAGIERCTDLLQAFSRFDGPSLVSARELSIRMAALARLMRLAIERAFTDEDQGGVLHAQLESFRKVLLHDLAADQFADMYAQTICYGLFAARFNFRGGEFRREAAAFLLPKTNPFLRQLFTHVAGPELDERVTWVVDDLAQLLGRTDTDAILRDFGKGSARHDPVLHFYETFLENYDPTLRERRGVYYTPEPVVSFIVKSVDKLLRTMLNMPQGLADAEKIHWRSIDGKRREYHRLLILDPAVGTGTFLHEVVQHIYANFSKNRGMWNPYISQHLLPRLFGFELLMAPYAIAHMKLGLELQALGYDFASDQRLHVYLTNSLEAAHEFVGLSLFSQWIAEEANAASSIKSDAPVMVVLGNPPYSGVSANMSPEIAASIDAYKVVDGQPLNERKHWLQDDYVKFVRFGQIRIDRTGHGILAFITNHAYLDNPTFRGMRQSLLRSFDSIHVLNLNGSAMRDVRPPQDVRDENVFDIKQGVAISIFVKRKNRKKEYADVQYADLWGPREPEPGLHPLVASVVNGKYDWLSENDVTTVKWARVSPDSPNYFFVPRDDTYRDEYERGFALDAIMPLHSTSVQTSRDAFVIDFDKGLLMSRIRDLGRSEIPDDEIRAKYALKDGRNWSLRSARQRISLEGVHDRDVQRILYRPFDERFIYFIDELINWPRHQVMDQMGDRNIAILVPRHLSGEQYSHVFCTRKISEMCVVSTATKEQNYHFPLYLPRGASPKFDLQGFDTNSGGRRLCNFTRQFISEVETRLGIEIGLDSGLRPEALLGYIYAVLHSPTYRIRFCEALRVGFPRIPLTSKRELFAKLSELGSELIQAHLLETRFVAISSFPESGDNLVKYVRAERMEAGDFRVHINPKQYFVAVPDRVWNFQLGGYIVGSKWLQVRVGRQLSYEDLQRFEQLVASIDLTCRLAGAIDQEIEQYGGWPLQ
jgi:hypothetical protein